jgi:hypothetical protein
VILERIDLLPELSSQATFQATKSSNYQMMEAIMSIVSFGSKKVPANTSGGPATPSFVPTHVGKHTVRIDAIALRNLIDKLKATLRR